MNSGVVAFTGSYNYPLVILSVIISIFASYAALDLAGRVTATRGWARLAWLSGGATAMGFGIWSMHYIGMLAFSLPVPVSYDWPTVVVSLLAAIFASGVALYVVSLKQLGRIKIVVGSILTGAGITAMHYIGMAAMRAHVMCQYNPWLVTLSVVLAMIVSLVAIWLAFHFRGDSLGAGWHKVWSAVVMGAAIPLMHYTGMAAASFTPTSDIPEMSHAISISTLGVASIIIVTFMVLGVALLTSMLDRRFSAQALDLNSSEQDLHSIIASALDSVVSMDAGGRVTVWNPMAEATFGWSGQEAVGKIISEMIIPPQYREAYERGLNHYLKTGECPALNRRFEITALHRDGHEFPVEVSISAVTRGLLPSFNAFIRDITESKKAEAELRLTQFSVEHAADGVFWMDAQGRIIRVNEAACRSLGRSREELLSLSIPDIDPDFPKEAWEAFWEKIKLCGAMAFETQHRTKEGWVFPVAITANYFEFNGKEYALAFVRDITKAKRAEEVVRRSETKFRTLFDSTSDAVMLMDEKGFFDCNKAALVIFGCSTREEFCTRHPADLSPPTQPCGTDSFTLANQHVATGMQKGSNHFEWVHKRADTGEIFPAEVLLTAMELDGKSILQAVVRDITESKKAEAALMEERHLLRTLMDNLPDLIYFKDLQSRFIRINNAHARAFGLDDPVQAVGHTDFDFFAAEHARQALEDEQEIVKSGKPMLGKEEKESWPDGRETWVSTTKMPLRDAHGNVIGTFGISRDVTQLRQAAQVLRNALEAAESATRAKSEFLANMSHEIRTPMNAIVGMTDMALDTDLTSDQREYLTTVKAGADSLLMLINDILDFSKIEAGKLELERISFQLWETLENTLRTLALRAHEKGLELACRVPPEMPACLVGDPDRLRQIIVNLVGNAVKFTSQGEVIVNVEVESQTEEDVGLHFSVKDTGIGIPAEKQAVIFKAFTQADTSTTRQFGGSGLGLAIATRLVEMMGGKLWLESEVGKGSTFHFTLHFPWMKNPANKPAPAESACLLDMPVLIVDDNATNRRILDEILCKWGMRPVSVDSGTEALAKMERAIKSGEPFPLMILDVNMPGMDGFTVAERVNQNPALSGATIMMLSSASRPGDISRCKEVGVAAYLMKPVRHVELLEAILEVLGGRVAKPNEVRISKKRSANELRCGISILLVEDNPVNQMVALRLLEKQKHRVLVAGNGREALLAMETTAFQGFDLVLMDVQMPEMDGLQVTAAIRQREKGLGLHVPIVAMTAHAMKGDKERCLAAGMDAYLSKPIRTKQLFEVIEILAGVPGITGMEPSTSSAKQEVLNKNSILTAFEGDHELVREVLGLFLKECPGQMATIREAVENSDAKEIFRAAHLLRGSLSNFSAAGAFQAAQNLETLGREGDVSKAGLAFHALEEQVSLLLCAMADFNGECAS